MTFSFQQDNKTVENSRKWRNWIDRTWHLFLLGKETSTGVTVGLITKFLMCATAYQCTTFTSKSGQSSRRQSLLPYILEIFCIPAEWEYVFVPTLSHFPGV
jgi:hypothetical protein